MSTNELICKAREQAGMAQEPAEPEYQNIAQAFTESARKFADRPAFTSIGRTITYRELDRMSNAFASYLQNDLEGLRRASSQVVATDRREKLAELEGLLADRLDRHESRFGFVLLVVAAALIAVLIYLGVTGWRRRRDVSHR